MKNAEIMVTIECFKNGNEEKRNVVRTKNEILRKRNVASCISVTFVTNQINYPVTLVSSIDLNCNNC